MPNDALKNLMSSGRVILADTKRPALQKKPQPSSITTPPESDPHKILVRRAISDRIPKKELVEEFQKFIKAAEDAL